ncbi:membrane protein [Bacillus phage YungSlug]|nr:membrane protein [Bacillus phage YungSlug]
MIAWFLFVVGFVFAITLLGNNNTWFLHFCSAVGMLFFVIGYLKDSDLMTTIWPIFIPFMFFSIITNLFWEEV